MENRLDDIEEEIDQLALENRDLDIRLTKIEKEGENNGKNNKIQ